jgi:uncharacterized membrane protein YhaH (DUF805 family)
MGRVPFVVVHLAANGLSYCTFYVGVVPPARLIDAGQPPTPSFFVSAAALLVLVEIHLWAQMRRLHDIGWARNWALPAVLIMAGLALWQFPYASLPGAAWFCVLAFWRGRAPDTESGERLTPFRERARRQREDWSSAADVGHVPVPPRARDADRSRRA